jgi:predicted house-cleaning NTP pyrophosphatase (Maf/HAM1 superfamily)
MLVLASGSSTRQLLLRNAGVAFQVDPAEIDERAAEQPLLESSAGPDDLALGACDGEGGACQREAQRRSGHRRRPGA